MKDRIQLGDQTIPIQLLLGGDLKFLNSMLGLKNNASIYPCPFCITHHDLLHLTVAELQQKMKDYESQLPTLKELTIQQGSGGRGSRGRAGRGRGRGRGAAQDLKELKLPPRTHLGVRSNEGQLIMAHLTSCEQCPGHCCWRAVVSGEEPSVLDSKAAEDRHHQLHYSTAYKKGMFFDCIAWEDVIIDVLHVMLRIVPAIYRVTVSAHVDSSELQSIAQWIFHTHRVVVASK